MRGGEKRADGKGERKGDSGYYRDKKNIKLHFIERKTPENLYMSDFFCTFARKNVQ